MAHLRMTGLEPTIIGTFEEFRFLILGDILPRLFVHAACELFDDWNCCIFRDRAVHDRTGGIEKKSRPGEGGNVRGRWRENASQQNV